MATIRNSPVPNYVGGGYQQTLDCGNGDSYNISNTPIPNFIGGGYQQKITKNDNSAPAFGWIGALLGLLGWGLCMLIPWLLMRL